jgi:serine protease Do
MKKPDGTLLRKLIAVSALILIGVGVGVLLTADWHWTAATMASQGTVAPPVNMAFNASSIPMVDANGQSPFVAVAERVAPTVVNVISDQKVNQNNQMEDFFRDSPFWEFFHRDFNNTPRRRVEHVPASGSGIIISQDGYILTNNHVVADADKVTVKTQDGHEFRATTVGADPETDVALIKVDHRFPPEDVAAIGNSDSIKVGEWAIAMGNPLGLNWTLTVGVVSATGRTNLAIAGGGPSFQDFIQTDASINFGNSGGPLCDIHGQVIGVNTAINPSGQGIGFAIPINMAMKVENEIRTKGSVSRGYLGMMPRELTPDLRSALNVPSDQSGIFVERVDKDTPASRGGLKAGDVVTKLNGKPIESVTQFRLAVADNAPGSKVSLQILRDGKNETLDFTLGDRSQLASLMGRNQGGKGDSGKETWLGVQVEPVTDEIARALNLDNTSGVIITDVDGDGPASGKLQERDVILEIDRKPVENLADFKTIANSLKDTKKAVLFRVIRDGQRTFEAVEP